jgi:hypothetical protein
MERLADDAVAIAARVKELEAERQAQLVRLGNLAAEEAAAEKRAKEEAAKNV